MSALVWCACACTLLAAATARRYERCDLARDLLRHGVQYDHLATWVCIAYHESRYDTAAINQHSHDYGILQISELFWCGSTGPNVCDVPCSDFVDDDIADDVRCALRIYREHTALQGDGFLAWVAYSSCREHHVKKYLADCGDVRKNITSDATARRTLKTLRPLAPAALNASYVKNVDQLKPPDFSGRALPGISSDYKQGRAPKMQTFDSETSNTLKFNIDDLRLPVFNQIPSSTEKPAYTTTTAPERSSEHTAYRPSTRKIVTLSTTTGRTPATSTSARTPTASPYLASTERATDRTTKQNIVTFPPFTNSSPPSSTTTKTTTSERTTYGPTTRKIVSFSTTTTSRPTAASKSSPLTWTKSPWLSTSERSIPGSSAVTAAPWRSTADGGASTVATWTTPRPVSSSTSLFDLYLHPKRPSPVTYSFAPFTGKRYRVQIFSGGSTTPHTPLYGKYVDLDVLKHSPGEEDASRHNRFLEEQDPPSASAARDYRSVRVR